MTKHSMPVAQAATLLSEAMNRQRFDVYITEVYRRHGVLPAILECTVFEAPYRSVEYMNTPAGLIVLAHHDSITGQVDGIHPLALSKSIDTPPNIVRPLSSTYNIHYMSRRSQGSLVLKAFGYNNSEARTLHAEEDEHFMLKIFDTPFGPIVGVLDGQDTVHVIRLSRQ